MSDEVWVPEAYYTPNATFDVYHQSFQLTYPDGTHQFAATLDSVMALQNIALQTGIIFGIQLGICVVLMLILALLTKPEKRRSAIFILNQASLVFIFIRSIVMCFTLVGPFYNYYAWISAYYSGVSYAQRLSITGEVFSFLTIVAVELSMLFQVRVVCCTLKAVLRHSITAVCVLMALLVCSIRFALMVVNAKWSIMNVDSWTVEHSRAITQLGTWYNIFTMTSVIFFSTIFCTKLGHAIYHRRKMGMKQFGPMQIIFVMGCQTLFIPAIFGLVAFYALKHSQVSSLVPLIVATFLPLSSMWASSNPSNINIAAVRKPTAYKPGMMLDSGNSNRSGYTAEKEHLTCTFNSQGTLVNETEEQAMHPKKLGGHASAKRDSIDVELAKMGHDIVVDRTYSIRSDSC